MSETASLLEYKQGPMFGMRVIDISSDDYTSPYTDLPFFTVAVKATTGNKVLHYIDALGNEHRRIWDVNKTVMGAHPGSDFPVPLFIQKVFADSDATEISVAW